MAEEKAKGGAATTAPAKEDGKAADEKPARKGLNKKVLVIAGILAADVAIMAGLAFFIVSKLKGEDPAAEIAREHEEQERRKKEMVTKIGKVLPKPLPFTVNIGGAGEGHYLKCAIQLEWEADEAAAEGAPDATALEIEKRMPKISDIIINILSSQSHQDLLKPSGKQKIKESIVTEINAILPEPHREGKEGHAAHSGKLRNAFFTEFLVQ